MTRPAPPDPWDALGAALLSGDIARLAPFAPRAGSLLRRGLARRDRSQSPADWLQGLFERSCQDAPSPGLALFLDWLESIPATERERAFQPAALRRFDLLRVCLSYGLSEPAWRLARMGALRSRSGLLPLPPSRKSPADSLLSEMLFSPAARAGERALDLWLLYLESPCWRRLPDSERLWALRSARAHPSFWRALAQSSLPLQPGFAAAPLLSPSPWARKGPLRLGSPLDEPKALQENIRLALLRGWITPRQASSYSRRKIQETPARLALERHLLERRLRPAQGLSRRESL